MVKHPVDFDADKQPLVLPGLSISYLTDLRDAVSPPTSTTTASLPVISIAIQFFIA
jgi:hypothetical protein